MAVAPTTRRISIYSLPALQETRLVVMQGGTRTVRTDSFLQLSDQSLHPLADLIANGSNHIDTLSRRVVEGPVLVAFAWIVGTGVTAAHRDHHIGGLDRVVGENLGLFGSDVDAFLGHRLNGYRVDLVGRFAAGRSDLDGTGRQLSQVSGGHLGPSGVVNADEQDRRPWLGAGSRFIRHRVGSRALSWDVSGVLAVLGLGVCCDASTASSVRGSVRTNRRLG